MPVTVALVVSFVKLFEIVALPAAFVLIPYFVLIASFVSVFSVPSFNVTVVLVPSDETDTTFSAFAAVSISKDVSLLDVTVTVPNLISAPSVKSATVVPFALTVTPSIEPIRSSSAYFFCFR